MASPVAVVGGSRAAMAVVSEGRTMHGGTYNSNPIACAAVLATMAATGRPGFYDELDARGRRLAEGLVEIARAADVEACWSGTGALFQLWFAAEPPTNYREAIAIVEQSPFPTFQRELLDRGILIQPPQEGLFLISAAHSDDDVDVTLQRAAEAMPAVALARSGGPGRSARRGSMRRAPGVLACTSLCAVLAATLGLEGASAARSSGGGTLKAAIADNPDHLDPGLSYATEGWETLEATGNGLLTFKKASGGAGAQIVPDLAVAMPTVSQGGRTYSFTMRTGVRFSPPVDRAVQPSDIKFAIERLFRISSGGVGFYTGIVGANAYAKTKKGGIKGIVANDAAHTITFHLTAPDGTFLDYVAIPFAFAVPKGTPDRDISTVARVACRHRPVHDHEVRPEAGDRAAAEPELPPVDRGLAERPPRRDRHQDRRRLPRPRSTRRATASSTGTSARCPATASPS